MDELDVVVVGAGLVGLAVARELALAGREVVILEAEDAIGTHTSSRNSEVIHAGIYYPKGSLKARACVEGKHLLYEYCAAHGVPHRRCGKLIVATDQAQLEELGAIRAKAHANGVTDVDWIAKEEVARMEPELFCVGALHSPSTGIIDSHALMLAYLGDAEANGAMLGLKSRFQRAAVRKGGFVLHAEGTDPIHCNVLVNSAGLRAPTVAKAIEGYRAELAPGEFYAKGNYYSLTRRSPFSRLVYPVPEPGGLGVHVTLDMGGQARFGPDVEWVERIDYDVDPRRAERFYAAIRRYWPGLPDGALAPGYAGIRPKTAGPKDPAPDFEIQGPRQHGVPGLVNLFGIESPGLTASLALARTVRGELSQDRATIREDKAMVSRRTLIAVAAASLSISAYAQTKWDMPTPYSDGEFHTRNVRAFADDVKKNSNGALEITVHSNNSLIKHPDILRAVSTGQVNIAEFLLGQFANEDPVFAADNVPFVAPGYDGAMKFYNAQKPVLEKKLQGRGLRLLYAVAWPGQGLYTKDPIKSVSDLKGQKMRTYSPLTSRLAELLGCTSVQVQVTDVPQMFATGAMQAMVTSSATGTATKAWEFVKNYTKTNAWNPKNVVVVNERAFRALPKPQQDALSKAAAAAEPRGWEMSKAREKEGDEALAKNGVTVVAASPELSAALSKIGQQMAAEWEKSAGADGQAILKAYRGK